MKEVVKDVEVRKGGDVSVFQEVTMGDEVIIEEAEGDSILRNFLYILNSMFRMNVTNDSAEAHGVSKSAQVSNPATAFVGISSVDASTQPITVNLSDNLFAENEGQHDKPVGVFIGGVQGNDGLNGAFISKAAIQQSSKVTVDVATTGTEDISFAKAAGIYTLYKTRSQPELFEESTFRDPTILLGGSTLSNTTGQGFLNDPLVPGSSTGQINYGSTNLNTPVINLNQQISTITISRDVTNQTASNIPVEEVGFIAAGTWANNLDRHSWSFLGRDLLSTNVPSKTTVTFNYKFRTTCESSGGILVQFNELFYRQLGQASRTVQDNENINRTDSDHESTFFSVTGGGDDGFLTEGYGGFTSTTPTSDIGEWVGVQVGASTKDVDEANFSLDNRISHGKTTGDLYYLGQSITPIEKDETNDRYFFDITRFFSNLSNATVSVGEVGHNVAHVNSDEVEYSSMIFRHLVEPKVSVDTGELLKVTYRVSVKPKA